MIPEQWVGSLPAKDGRFKRDGEKELWTPSPHVDDEKDKRAIVYKTKKKEERGSDQKRSLGHAWRDSWLKTMLIALVALH